jgi:hypothetical protein
VAAKEGSAKIRKSQLAKGNLQELSDAYKSNRQEQSWQTLQVKAQALAKKLSAKQAGLNRSTSDVLHCNKLSITADRTMDVKTKVLMSKSKLIKKMASKNRLSSNSIYQEIELIVENQKLEESKATAFRPDHSELATPY